MVILYILTAFTYLGLELFSHHAPPAGTPPPPLCAGSPGHFGTFRCAMLTNMQVRRTLYNKHAGCMQ